MRLVQHVVDEGVHLHVVGDVARAVRDQHVAVRIDNEMGRGREDSLDGREGLPVGEN